MSDPCVARPALSFGEIHVWTARLADEHHAIADLLRILSREERTQAAQFSFERDRMRFIQAHGVVRRERPPQGRSKNALRGNCRCEIFRG